MDNELSKQLNEKIEQQIKFLYGKYYDVAIRGEIIYIEQNTTANNIDFSSDELINLETNVLNFVEEEKKRYDYRGYDPTFFIDYFLKYYNKKENTVLRFILHDDPFVNNFMPYYGFYMGTSRCLTSDDFHKPIIIPSMWSMGVITKQLGNDKDDISFDNKSNKLIFRGGTNGSVKFPKREYNSTIRYQIISQNFDKYEGIDVGFSYLTVHANDDGFYEQYNKLLKDNLSLQDIFKNKFVLCIGGNCCSTMFTEVLALSNCCPFHTYPFDFEDYFNLNLQPYVHFIPVNVDGSDLKSQYDWCLNNLDKCKQISDNGTEYMKFYTDLNILNKTAQRFCELYPIVKYKE